MLFRSADGVIYYTVAPDGTAQMKLINADGSPSELSGNGLRCLAALVLYKREQSRQAPLNDVRVDTEAGWKTLSLISRQGSRYTFRAAMGHPERLQQETLSAAGETLPVTTGSALWAEATWATPRSSAKSKEREVCLGRPNVFAPFADRWCGS